jgi:hypothetical protein
MLRILHRIELILCALGCFYISGLAQDRAVSAAPEPSIRTFFTGAEEEKVSNGGIVSISFLFGDKTRSTESAADTIRIPTCSLLRDYSEYEVLCTEQAFFPIQIMESTTLDFLNYIVQYSGLAGLHYYSETDKRIQPEILASTRILSAEKAQPVADSSYSSVLAECVHYFQIQDNRFGKLRLMSQVFVRGNNFIIRNTSIQPMSKLGFLINRPGEYETIFILIYDASRSGYFYYALQAMRLRSHFLLKLGKLTAENMANRLRASTVYLARFFKLDWSDRLEVITK